MATESKLQTWIDQITEKLSEQEWYQTLRSKWDELDPKSRTYLQFAMGAGAIGLILLLMIGSMLNVRTLHRELDEKAELLSYLQTANEEMRAAREAGESEVAEDPTTANLPWAGFLENMATQSTIDKLSLEISAEKPGLGNEHATESQMEVSLKHVSIKQIARFAFRIENGPRSVRIRNLAIDTGNDPLGYMNGKLLISAFMVK